MVHVIVHVIVRVHLCGTLSMDLTLGAKLRGARAHLPRGERDEHGSRGKYPRRGRSRGGAGSAYCAKLSSQPSLALTSDATRAPIPSLVCTARRSSMISSAAFSGEVVQSPVHHAHGITGMPARFTIKVSVVYDRDAVRRMWSSGPRGVDGRDTRGTARAPARASASAPAFVDDLADDGRGFLSFPARRRRRRRRRRRDVSRRGRKKDVLATERRKDARATEPRTSSWPSASVRIRVAGVGSSSAAAAGAGDARLPRGYAEASSASRSRSAARSDGADARRPAPDVFSFTTSVYPGRAAGLGTGEASDPSGAGSPAAAADAAATRPMAVFLARCGETVNSGRNARAEMGAAREPDADPPARAGSHLGTDLLSRMWRRARS